MIPFHTQLKQINRNKLILLEHEIMFLKTLTTYRQVYLKHGYTNHKHLTKQSTPTPPRPAHTKYIYPSPTHPNSHPQTHI